jgi:hypothetical protein
MYLFLSDETNTTQNDAVRFLIFGALLIPMENAAGGRGRGFTNSQTCWLEQLKDVPQPVVVLLEVLLAKDPVHRFQNPAELLKAMPTVRDAINAGRSMMKTIRRRSKA